MKPAKLFFITGVSSGFGRALAEQALLAGHRVVGTVRNQPAKAAFEALSPGRSFGRTLDVTDFSAIPPLVAAVEREVGAVDVLVNNAGYGHEGIMEESSIDEMVQQFNVNVFGAVALMKAFLPYFRARRAGHIVNITSMGGFITMPGISYYCGSKFALQGISETLTQELKPFNIAVTAVQPGSFRTDWAGRSMVRAARSISDYDDSFGPIREARMTRSGHQPGDPRKAADAILQLIDSPAPPTALLLGSDAVTLVREKLQRMQAEINAWETVSGSTDG
ncbi:oxidoreductase [Serratia rubidaea]|uniref:oxidoreductase n=1 Tax=Serratia rubidaea TaxID=61652 RepID=UPI001BAF5226|nr:oxidoreductase [Serratia rubidaea]MBS0973252.1 oxidoreductase [Serratia rubidaea]MDC6110791.1 oxidoreductase [Serratia rubidaea]MDK1703106.1 oxidoreductase [Serratia rubidaea]